MLSLVGRAPFSFDRSGNRKEGKKDNERRVAAASVKHRRTKGSGYSEIRKRVPSDPVYRVVGLYVLEGIWNCPPVRIFSGSHPSRTDLKRWEVGPGPTSRLGLQPTLAALLEKRFEGPVCNRQFRMWPSKGSVDVFNEFAVRTEANTVVQAYQTEPTDSAKERTVARVALKVGTHQGGQRRHLFDQRQVHNFFRQLDDVPSATSRSKERDAGRHARFALNIDVGSEVFGGGFANDRNAL